MHGLSVVNYHRWFNSPCLYLVKVVRCFKTTHRDQYLLTLDPYYIQGIQFVPLEFSSFPEFSRAVFVMNLHVNPFKRYTIRSVLRTPITITVISVPFYRFSLFGPFFLWNPRSPNQVSRDRSSFVLSKIRICPDLYMFYETVLKSNALSFLDLGPKPHLNSISNSK